MLFSTKRASLDSRSINHRHRYSKPLRTHVEFPQINHTHILNLNPLHSFWLLHLLFQSTVIGHVGELGKKKR
ncbi:hypothetical protein PanWU01x14_316090 [Parasponia andersonii]|uniref:Uncharacterized protein n=1 Tax=Parasponia andersonii TaxID=3476 RepID=A0A2P5AN59_PARAD|nr:hypothetical protein PanWU01x14_316090 [Parasponia andersonii]